ncbi:MAG: hypothetical protein ACTHJV_02900 [Rhizobiaceae bacterium]
MNACRTVLFSAALLVAAGFPAFAQTGGGMGDYMSKHSGSDSRSKNPGTTGTTTTQNGSASKNKTSGKNCTQKGGGKAQGHGEKC